LARLSYRGDIDGLRAIAVMAVVAFHADLGFTGGFVGVDVFFVISGFLITSLVWAELERGEFTILRFWDRRIRRIWPAAIGMTLCTLAAATLVMLPSDYYNTAGDAVSHVVMLANVRFWRRLDYFSDAELAPLLHLWSLAVEEQFYLILPLLLLILFPIGKTAAVLTLLSITLCSYAWASHACTSTPSAAFFLLPFRAWELLTGSLLALYPLHIRSARLAALLGWAGMALIVGSCLAYDRHTSFPGFAATVPCLGTAAVIAAGAAWKTSLQAILASRPLQLIGLTSYSLYLWHWPILAFARYVFGYSLSAQVLTLALLTTVVAAALSYRLIETPFRNLHTQTYKQLGLAICMFASLALVAISMGIRKLDGLPGRFEPSILSANCAQLCRQWRFPAPAIDRLRPTDDLVRIGELPSVAGVARERRPHFLFWGDSHGMAISPAIDCAAKKRGLSGQAMLLDGHIAIPSLRVPSQDTNLPFDAIRLRSTMLDWIRVHHPQHVILCCRWTMYLADHYPDTRSSFLAPLEFNGTTDSTVAATAFDSGLTLLLDTCESVNAKVWLLTEVPFQRLTPFQRIDAVRRTGKHGQIPGTMTPHEHRLLQQPVLDRLSQFTARALAVVDLAEGLWDGQGGSLIGADGKLWYADDDHLNSWGAVEGASCAVEKMFDEMCGPGT
jgi:peptidoglycan/LPS O-acetylase OafA/YrhL